MIFVNCMINNHSCAVKFKLYIICVNRFGSTIEVTTAPRTERQKRERRGYAFREGYHFRKIGNHKPIPPSKMGRSYGISSVLMSLNFVRFGYISKSLFNNFACLLQFVSYR